MGISHKGNGGGNRGGRPYGLMLLVAFGVALLGVMVLHKLRERRIFNLLVTEKDRELFSLQLLLQKERENTKETQRRTEEMKAKVYFLRNQKMELESRLMEMQSTIYTLKDDQKTMESAFEEKQNEIKMLRETEEDFSFGGKNSQVIAQTENSKQNEDEVQDSRHHLEYPSKVWSVSTDDPSNPILTSTLSNNANQTAVINDSKQQGRHPDEVTSTENGGNSTRIEDWSENVFSNSRVRENSSQDAAGMSSIANSGEATMYTGGKEAKTVVKQDEEHEASRDEQPGKLENLSAGQSWNSQSTWKREKKLNQADNSMGEVAQVRGKRGRLSKTKGKRWIVLEKKRPLKNRGNSEDSDAAAMRRQNILNDVTSGLYIREGVPSIDAEEAEREVGKNKPTRARMTLESPTATLMKLRLPEDTGSSDHEAVNVNKNEDVIALLKRPQTFQNDKMIARESPEGESHNVNPDEKKPNLDQATQTEAHDGGDIHESAGGSDVNNVEQEKAASKPRVQEDMEVANTQGDSDLDNNEFFSSGDDNEEYNEEEIDESEF